MLPCEDRSFRGTDFAARICPITLRFALRALRGAKNAKDVFHVASGAKARHTVSKPGVLASSFPACMDLVGFRAGGVSLPLGVRHPGRNVGL